MVNIFHDDEFNLRICLSGYHCACLVEVVVCSLMVHTVSIYGAHDHE